MATLSRKVKLYLKANSKTWEAEQNNIFLQDDRIDRVSSPYIKSWNVSGLAEPTAEQLASYDSAATTEQNNEVVRATRKAAYGDYGDQLDEIFKNIDDWKTRIQSIKDANPKE